MYFPTYFENDKVNYVGRKFSSELGTKMGIVCGRVQGEDGMVAVDFGGDAYVVHESSLRRLIPSKDKEVEVEISRRLLTDE